VCVVGASHPYYCVTAERSYDGEREIWLAPP
jgi:hypothetical protein